ncbi:hypothetical protein OMK68_22050 [Rhodococcus pyridinivorans]|nr:hypothetical protein [Rhodococcus pyridinivorans]MCW3472277.1 hypothetical protein [Rhodococcus pyridinivorans]
MLSSGGRRAYPEKLIPDDPQLPAYLRRHGDLIPAAFAVTGAKM